MSDNVNQRLLERGAEIFDSLHKYEQDKYELAIKENDLDIVHQIVQQHEATERVEQFGGLINIEEFDATVKALRADRVRAPKL